MSLNKFKQVPNRLIFLMNNLNGVDFKQGGFKWGGFFHFNISTVKFTEMNSKFKPT